DEYEPREEQTYERRPANAAEAGGDARPDPTRAESKEVRAAVVDAEGERARPPRDEQWVDETAVDGGENTRASRLDLHQTPNVYNRTPHKASPYHTHNGRPAWIGRLAFSHALTLHAAGLYRRKVAFGRRRLMSEFLVRSY